MLVYFVQRGENGPIKIGRSTDVQSRLRSLQTGCAEKLVLLRTVQENEHQTESLYHSMFKEHRLEGEWFKPEPAVLACAKAPVVELCPVATEFKKTKTEQPTKECWCDSTYPALCHSCFSTKEKARLIKYAAILAALPPSRRYISRVTKCVSCDEVKASHMDDCNVCWDCGTQDGKLTDQQYING